jgi:hypothetical protein
MANEIPTATRRKVIDRDEDRCWVCGMRGSEIQHRKRRREGGHGMANLIRVCRTCHHDKIHRNPRWAMENGYTVSSYMNPAEMPIKRWDGAVILLDDEGGMEFVSA